VRLTLSYTVRMGRGWDHQIRTEKVCKQQVF